MSDGLRCDICERFAPYGDTDGWLTVEALRARPTDSFHAMMFGSSRSRALHVCSWACLGMLAIKAPEEEVEA